MSEPRASKQRVLFLCTGNTARSQMAEALLRHHAPDRYEAFSAGMEPRAEIHPLTLRVLDEAGIDTAGLHPKDTREFLGRVSITYSVVVCNRAQQACPQMFPFTRRNLYWPFDDPVAVLGSEAEQLTAFRRTRDEIETRILQFLREEVD